MTRDLALIILDGWGHTDVTEGNAFKLAATPYLDDLFARYPRMLLGTSGMCVGLPEGQMGNSEVGHMNMGAGRIVYQDFTRINKAIEDGELAANPVLSDAFKRASSGTGRLHLMGLVSDGGVHSHQEHLYALLKGAKQAGVAEVFVHALTDGRDTSPTEGLGFLERLLAVMSELKIGKLGVVCGRYYMMDRDNRWERIEKGYRALIRGEGRRSRDILATMRDCYARDETDEFLLPTVMEDESGTPVGTPREGDVFVTFNFRADRVRQITRCLMLDFDVFDVSDRPSLYYVCMTEYDASFGLPIAFAPQRVTQTMGEIIANEGRTQLRIAETEKYAHVTFFFNGGEEKLFAGEERVLIPSPKVQTYDLQPEMSVSEVTDSLISRIKAVDFGLVVMNYANPDMVGHTGKLEAAIRAMESVDKALSRSIPSLMERGFTVFLTADHGNLEQMHDYETGAPFTEHTLNPVHLVVTDDSLEPDRERGRLCDLAPTMLAYGGRTVPAVMKGDVLMRRR